MSHLRSTKRTERLQVMLNAEEMRVLDQWRFEHRMPSRAAAIRQLIRHGLQLEYELDADVTPPENFASGEIGIVQSPIRIREDRKTSPQKASAEV